MILKLLQRSQRSGLCNHNTPHVVPFQFIARIGWPEVLPLPTPQDEERGLVEGAELDDVHHF